MFAPSGFITLSSAVSGLFEGEPERREWLHSIVTLSGLENGEMDDDFLSYRAFRARVYTYQEVRYLALEMALEGEVVFACHPDKGTWKFEFPVFMRQFGYRDVLRGLSTDSDFFDYGLDWLSYEKEISDCVLAKKDPWTEFFLRSPPTSPGLFLNESSWVLDFSEARRLDFHLLAGFPIEHYGYPFKLSDVEPFEGWALCLEEANFSRENFNRRYVEGAAEVVVGAALGGDFVQEFKADRPDDWQRFVFGNAGPVDFSSGETIAAESRALRFLRGFVEEHGQAHTKAELKSRCPESISARGFERVWARLRDEFPDLSRPGRRAK